MQKQNASVLRARKAAPKWLVIALLVIVFPVGLYMVWKRSEWSSRTKKLTTIGIAIGIVLIVVLSVIFAPPTIKVTSSRSPTISDKYSLAGEVIPSGAIVTINGKTVAVSGGRFSTTVDLKQGDNMITILARSGSKESRQEVTVHRYTSTEIARQEQEAAAKKKQQEDQKATDTKQQTKATATTKQPSSQTATKQSTQPKPNSPQLRQDLAFQGDATYCNGIYKDNGNGTTTWSYDIKQNGELITHLSANNGQIYRHDVQITNAPNYYSYTAPVSINDVAEIDGVFTLPGDSSGHPCNLSPQQQPQQSY